ncbi:MAG: histidine phosphotransferase family protein [Marivita sp.]|nr:histidine phosphotransferase family protein [Marivita sp.]
MGDDIVQRDGASLAALIGSRICHDLISPIGAISNGLELVGMTSGMANGPEMSLIQQSCDHATARIRFFRIAFGTAADARVIPVAEARRTLADHYSGTRIAAEWHVDTDLGRDLTQLAYLGALCLETALPQGGALTISRQDQTLVATARADVLRRGQPVWSILTADICTDLSELRPSEVQFALLARLCSDRAVTPTLTETADRTELQLDLPRLRA